jgi:hypothetical protein
MLAAMAPGGFIERPLGATDTGEQARNVLEVAAAARAAGLDGLLYGDNHAVPAVFANSFAPMVRHIVGEHDAMLRSFARIGESLMPAIREL